MQKIPRVACLRGGAHRRQHVIRCYRAPCRAVDVTYSMVFWWSWDVQWLHNRQWWNYMDKWGRSMDGSDREQLHEAIMHCSSLNIRVSTVSSNASFGSLYTSLCQHHHSLDIEYSTVNPPSWPRPSFSGPTSRGQWLLRIEVDSSAYQSEDAHRVPQHGDARAPDGAESVG